MNGATPWLETVAPTTTITSASPDSQDDRLQAFEAQLQGGERPRRHQLQADRDHDRQYDGHAPQRRRAGRHQTREERADEADVLAAEQDPAEDDQVEGHQPAQPYRRPQAPAKRVLGDEPGAVETLPTARTSRPRRARGRRAPS